MLRSKLSFIQPLLESTNGIHLTAYIENTGNLKQMRHQIREALEIARENLNPVLRPEEINKLLDPVVNLKLDPRMLKSFRGNIGIFRTPDSFRVLNIPVPVEHTCVVATTFHVKPLLRWVQNDPDYLLLGVEPGMATLYRGTQNSFEMLETILLPDNASSMENLDDGSYASLKMRRYKNLNFNKTTSWLNVWLKELTTQNRPRLYLAGDKKYTDILLNHLDYPHLHSSAVASYFNQSMGAQISNEIRNLIRKETKQKLKDALLEYHWAEELNLAKKNIFQIARAAILGKIKKLIVADDISIFGKIDKKTGGLRIHPVDLDHEDDDILDDLAQTVLAQGGEVIIAPRDEIPKGRPALAIIKTESERSTYVAHSI